MILVAQYTPKPKDPSQNMTVTMKSMDGRIQYSITALDGNAIPEGSLKVVYNYRIVVDDRTYVKQGTMDISVAVDGYSGYAVGNFELPSDKTITSLNATFQYVIDGTGYNEKSATIFL